MVTTWFVHHDHAPLCLVGRLVRLSHRPIEWLQLLTAPWIHMLRPFENVAFRIVRPGPISHIPGMHMVHVILEQGLQQARSTALFSVIFQGMHGDVTHRRAQSIPTALSRDVIIRIVGISELCQARRCIAWSGRMQFHRNHLDQVFSGIGISLTVDAFRNRFAHVDDEGFPLDAASSSSQVPPRMSFRADDASLFPSCDMVSDDDSDCRPEHAHGRLIPELTVIWQTYLMSNAARPFRFYVETWYCDHDRFPRTNRGREVLLPPDPSTWRQAIVDKWQDIIDPGAELFIYVVSPPPLGGPSEVLAHVLLAQHQHRGFISALITTLAPGDDPWDPPRVALKLPSVVDKGLLIQESGLFMFCPPFIPFNECRATIGAHTIFHDVLRSSHSGDGFLCVAETQDATLASAVSADSTTDFRSHVSKLFTSLAAVITQTTCTVLRAAQHQPIWASTVESLMQDIDCLAGDVRAFLSAMQSSSPVQSGIQVPPMSSPILSASHGGESCYHAPGVVLNGICPSVSVDCLAPLIKCWKAWKADPSRCTPFLVAVWYVDHLRSPTCRQSQIVELNVPFAQWTNVLLRSWCKEVWPYAEVQICLVSPTPQFGDTGVQAHVMLLQQPLPGLTSIILDTLVGSPDKPVHASQALTVPGDFCTASVHAVMAQQAVQCPPHEIVPYQLACGSLTWDSVQEKEITHATCITAIPCWPPEAWAGVSDPTFAALLRSHHKHFEGPPVNDHSQGKGPCSGFPVTLSLDAVVPRCRKNLPQPWSDQLSTLEWFKSAAWKKEIAESLDLILSPVPPHICLTGATTAAIFEAMEGTIGPYEKIELYVDGATSSTAAGWSVVAVVHSGNSARLLGTLAGPVVLGDQHDAWLGAHTTDNIAAELHALAAALALAIQVDFPCPIFVRPDLSLSRLIAQELVTTISNPVLAKVCRVLAAWVPPTLCFQEVRGHTQQPWNDLADSVAKHVLTHPEMYPAVSFGRLHALARECHDIEWLWVQNLPFPMQHCLPNLVEDSVWQFPPSLRKVAPPALDVTPLVEPMHFQCQMATINVLALDKIDGQTEVGRRTGARTLRLDHQLHAGQFHIVGLQETRTISGSFQTDHYILLSSGCVGPAAARLGCELWLYRSLPLLTTPEGQKVTFSDCTRIVKHADPRRLFVKLEHRHFAITAVVLHAPCLGKATGDASAPIDVIKQWWVETSVLWHQMVDTDMTCVFVDANATLATACTEFFQDHHADATTAQTVVFEEFLADHAMFAPSTFASHHVGPSFTWTHSSGRRMRLDYVLLSRTLFEMVARSATWTSYDGTFTHEDHIPACIELDGWLQCAVPVTGAQWDDLALLDPQRCQDFQAALATLPLPTWEVSTDSHCTLFEKQYLQLAKQFFTRKQGQRSRPPLKPDTLDAIAFKRHILDCGRSMQLMTDPDFKMDLKAIELQVRKLVARDLREFYDQILVHLQEAGHLSDHKQMFRMLGRLGGKRHKMKLSARPCLCPC